MIEQIKTVKELIDKERNVLRKIAQDPEADPIMIDGITSKNVYVSGKVAADKVAKIMLEYDHPIYSVLGEDAPDDMWKRLAEEFGLDNISSVDIGLGGSYDK